MSETNSTPSPVKSGHILARHPFPASGALATATLPVHALLPHDISYLLAAFILAMIGGVYIGFAVNDRRLSRLVLETVVATGFTLYAAVFFYHASLWLAFGYVLHGIWDAVHHSPLFDVKMARWWIPACAVYDIIAGVGLIIIWTW